MNTPQEKANAERFHQLEGAVGILQRQVRDLEAALSDVRSALARSPGLTPPLAQVFCPRCRKGNAPGAAMCRWCGWRLAAVVPRPGPTASVDQGWLTPALRVAGGLALGAALLGLGLRFARARRRFSQVLLGGSIATFYMTGFATYQLFQLAPYPVVFGFMVAITALALGLALRQDDPMLSIIGTLGGLATPFLLYTTAGSTGGLVVYSCVILAGTSALYFLRGWRWLQFTAYAGFWAVLVTAYVSSIRPVLDYSTLFASGVALVPPAGDQWALQAGVAWGWLAFWAVPLLRAVRSTGVSRRLAPDTGDVQRFIVAATLIAAGFSRVLWALPNGTFSLVVFAGAALYGGVAWWLRPREARLAYTQAALALLLFTLGLVLLLHGEALIFSLAAEAAVFHLLATRLGDRGLAYTAHGLFAGVAAWLVVRLAGAHSGDLLLVNPQALTDLAVIALALGASRTCATGRWSRATGWRPTMRSPAGYGVNSPMYRRGRVMSCSPGLRWPRGCSCSRTAPATSTPASRPTLCSGWRVYCSQSASPAATRAASPSSI